MDITQNYFQVFGIDIAFDVDIAMLSISYRKLQKEVHPDKFASASDREKRVSVQYAAYINEAYNVLKSPLLRASYLLELNEGDLCQFQKITVPPVFLMEQVELREELSDIGELQEPEAALENIAEVVRGKLTELSREFSEFFNHKKYEEAYQATLKMQFLEKIVIEIILLEEKLLD